jgi:hypothetical protein
MRESHLLLLPRWLKAYLAFPFVIALVLAGSLAHSQTTIQVTVPANPLWTDTGIALSAGQYAAISASGTWCWSHTFCNGPDGSPAFQPLAYDEFEFFDAFDHGRLIAFVGADPYQGQWGNYEFFAQTSGYVSVGSGQTFPAPYSGELWLGINAGAVTESVSESSGHLIAKVTVGGGDTTAPVIDITIPSTVYRQNQKLDARYSCTDSNYPVESCNGTVANSSPVNTSSTGPQGFTVVAVDSKGNPSSKDVVYFVGNAGLSPQSLVYPPQVVATSTSQKVTLFNRQSSTLNISSIDTSGRLGNSFSDTTNCGPTLAPLKNCAIFVTYNATTTGARQGLLNVSTDAGSLSIPLVAYGAPAILHPASFTYAAQAVGTTSAVKDILLENNQTEALSISSINLAGDFAVASNSCPVPGELQRSCVIGVTFKPTAVGKRTGTLIVQANYPTAPAAVKLIGTGEAQAATPMFSPGAGTYSSAQPVTISDSTPGASIYYAVNATPTCSSTLYSSPVTISSSETLEGIACASGYANSNVGSATYTISGGSSSCMSPVSIGAYTSCGAFFNSLGTDKQKVSATYAPSSGNGVLIYATWCSTSTCSGFVSTITPTLSDNINSPETCFHLSPHSPYYMDNSSVPDYVTGYVWYCPSIPSGVTSFTVTTSGTGSSGTTYLVITGSEWKAGSIAATGYFENVDNSITSNNTPSISASVPTSAATAYSNDLVTGLITLCGGTINIAAGTGFTSLIANPPTDPGALLEAKAVTSAGTQTAIATWPAAVTSGNCNLSSPSNYDTWYGMIVPLVAASQPSVSALGITFSGNQQISGNQCFECSSAPQAATPTANVASGTYSSAQTGSLSDSTTGATITYCEDTANYCPPAIGGATRY